MDLSGLGRILIVVGILAALVGIAFVIGGRLGLGRLPGDLSFRLGRGRVYLPLATSLLVSVALTIILNVILRR